MQKFIHFFEQLFPEEPVVAQRLTIPQQAGLFGLLTLVFSLFGLLIPADGFLAFDWLHFFGIGNIPPFYPPWAGWLVSLLTWPTLIGLTLAAVGFAGFQRARHGLSLACVFLSLPVLWTLFLGQVDGLVLLGTLGLPWLAPLVLLKPQISIFSFLARKSSLLGLGLTLLGSFAIWGFWPLRMFSVWTVHAEGKYPNDIAIGLWGLPIALVLLWFSRGDMDMLMLAGTLITPYLLPYNLIVVAPAIARMSPPMALIALALSWAPLSANWLGPVGWWLGWLFIIWMWLCLAGMRYPDSIFARVLRKLRLVPSEPVTYRDTQTQTA